MNIYVGNLPFRISEDGLRQEFEAFGTVSRVKIVTDMETGRSRGFGFVEMDDDAQARNAISNLDGKEIEGRALKVNEARPREEGRGPSRGGGGGRRPY
jgi:RNA recognition motif-containing protein